VKLCVSVLWAVSTAQSLYKTNNLPALLESGIHNGNVYVLGKQRIRGDHDVPARNKNTHRLFGEIREE
jgi:hypothetical protein